VGGQDASGLPVNAEELAYAGVARQADLVRAGEVSARELTEIYLQRIQAIDHELNAYRVVYWEAALAEADAADARRAGSAGPLNGVPIAIKDRFDVAGDVTTFGSAAYGGPARADAEIVKRLRRAGAVILGKTHLPELAIWGMTESRAWGITHNPWALDRTPGGSSGGSAAAVAAALAAGATGSDSAGSIRVPAACCGLFGLKPQRGRISLMPEPEHWFGLSCAGFLTRSVVDTALLLDVCAGPAPGDFDAAGPPSRPFVESARPPHSPMRIAVSHEPPIPARIDPRQAEVVRDAADLLRTLGHTVTEADPDYGNLSSLLVPRYLRGVHEQARAMAHPERLERRTRVLSRIGRFVPRRWAASAREREPAHAKRVNAIFDDHDVVLVPMMAQPPAPIMDVEGSGAVRALLEQWRRYPFSGVWNALGNPAAAVPAGFTDDGLPIAIQLVGRPDDEQALLSLAAELEAERPWARHRPPVA
jgi:amidase